MFTLKFNTENAIFCNPLTGEESKGCKLIESAKILSNISKEMVINGKTSGSIMDSNGNVIGKWELE